MKSLPKKLVLFLLLIVCGMAMTASGEPEVSGAVVVLDIDGTIGPATGDYIEGSLEKATAAALAQIKDRDYAAELRGHGCVRIIGVGIAIHGKELRLDHVSL